MLPMLPIGLWTGNHLDNWHCAGCATLKLTYLNQGATTAKEDRS
jgi:hypothetical protein